MLVEMTLEVTAKEFFDLLIESLYQELKAENSKIKKEDIKKGYSQKKIINGKMKQTATTTMKITECKANEEYSVCFVSERGETSMCYKIEDKETFINVSYEEKFECESKLTSLNYKLVSGFYAKKSKRKIIKMLQSMEAYILQNKEN